MAHMARSLLAVRLAVILALSTSFVGASDPINVNVATVATGVAASVTGLTSQVQALISPANAMGLSVLTNNVLLTLQGPALDVVQGLHNLVASGNALVASLQTAVKTEGAVSTADASQIAAAFQAFVVAEQALLATLISKASLFTGVSAVVQPVGVALQSVHTFVDQLSYTLYTLVQTSQVDVNAIKNAQASLDLTLGLSAKVWGLTV